MEEQYFDEQEESEVEELSLSDRVMGVFAEPSAMFSKLAMGQAKVTDWLLPLLLIIVVAIATQFVVLSNPSLKQQAVNKQIETIQEQFSSAVESGKMSQAQADEQLEKIQDNMENQMAAGAIIQVVAIVIMSFVFFFVISAYFILGSKFILKGQATYSEGLSAFGMPGYITVIQLALTIVLIVVFDSVDSGTNLAKFMGMNVKELGGYVLSYVDPLKIWAYAVMAIGLAKMNKSESTGKYYAFVFGSWIIVGMLFFFLTEAVPFMKSFIQ